MKINGEWLLQEAAHIILLAKYNVVRKTEPEKITLTNIEI
jgi:hypothetical protein